MCKIMHCLSFAMPCDASTPHEQLCTNQHHKLRAYQSAAAERKLDVLALRKVPVMVHNPGRSWKNGQHDQPR
jgi:hypothetical protein